MPRPPAWRDLRRVTRPEVWALPVVILSLWYVAQSRSDVWYFPSPTDVAVASWELVTDEFMEVVAPSFTRLALGFFLGVAVAVLIGSFIGSIGALYRLCRPLVDFWRSTPAAAFVPALMAIFGSTPTTRVAIIAFGTATVMVVSTMDGVRRTDPMLLDAARMSGLSRAGTVLRVRLPSATPSVLAGMRIAVVVAVVMMIISELTGTGGTLGSYLTRAQALYQTEKLLAGTLLLGLTAWLLTTALLLLERLLLPWRRRYG